MMRLIREKDFRICSRRYFTTDQPQLDGGQYTDSHGCYVFPDDAKDIKAHRWFKHIRWDYLHTERPPFVPNLQNDEDAHYFDESEPLEDWSETVRSDIPLSPEDVLEKLQGIRPNVQEKAMELIRTPINSVRLQNVDHFLDSAHDLDPDEVLMLKQFVRLYGHKERKRPRDMLLRDKNIRETVMDIRKETAFLGYNWRRMRPSGYTTTE